MRSDYPHVQRWCAEMLALLPDAGRRLFDLADARAGYYKDLFPLNPGGIVPTGPSESDLGWPTAAASDEGAFAWR